MSIEELKELQLKVIKKNKICNVIGAMIIILALGVIIFIGMINKINMQSLLISCFFVFVFSFIVLMITKGIVNGKDIDTFNKTYKNLFVLKSLETKFDNLVFKPEQGFSKAYVNEIGMIDTADRFRSNDYIAGTYKGIKFEQSDMHIEEEHESTDSDGNTTTTWITIFRGRLMVFDFNKSFKANILVSSKYFSADRLPWGKRFSKIKMEDIEFNKKFSVYSQSEHEAFYILTPHFMEKIKILTNELNCGIMFAFVDNKLHIAINNNKDSFEANVFKIINEQEINENITSDIDLITNFVEELKLDKDLFRKGV